MTRSVTSVSAAAVVPAAPDSRRQLDDGDITYAIRLAPTPNANTITDALLASYRTPLTRPQLLHIVQLLLDLLRDTAGFLTERIFVARLSDQSSDEILDEIVRLLSRFTTVNAGSSRALRRPDLVFVVPEKKKLKKPGRESSRTPTRRCTSTFQPDYD